MVDSPESNHYQRALVAFRLRNWAVVKTELGKELSINPDNSDALALLGACSLNMGQVDDGLSQAKESVRLNPGNDYAIYILSSAQLAKGLSFEAEISIEEALKLRPESSTYLIALADMKPKFSPEAVELLERALSLDPQNASAMIKLEERYRGAGRKQKALEMRSLALSLFPDDPRIQASSGWQALEAPGGHEAALAHFQEAVRLNPNERASVEGLVRAKYQNKSPLARLVKLCSWKIMGLIFFAGASASVLYFVVGEYVLHVTVDESLICFLTISPLLLMFGVICLDILDRLIFYVSLLFNRHERAALWPRFNHSVYGVLGGIVIAAIAIWMERNNLYHPELIPVPHWLFSDWVKFVPRYALLMPFIFIGACIGLLASLWCVISTHIYRKPRTTNYFLSLYGIVWCLDLLSWFVVMAIYQNWDIYLWVQVLVMVVLFAVPQTKLCRNYVKETIRKDQGKG